MSELVSNDVKTELKTAFTQAHPKSFRERFKIYKELSKSGIVALVLISVTAGYFLGLEPEAPILLSHFFATLLGVLFLASGSSALNQIQEQHIDQLMPRTAKRPLPSGKLSPWEAWIFVGASLFVGALILFSIDWKVGLLGIAAVISYNGLYTLWWKPQWSFAAVPGAVPGALPILMGYGAANGSVTAAEGFYLFLILFYWQMPHFWSLAIRFRKDYLLGRVPTLPVSKGVDVTRFQIIIWTFCYVAILCLAPLFFSTSLIYFVSLAFVGLKVLLELRRFVLDENEKAWLRFFLWINFSLIILLGALCVDVWRYHLFQSWITW